MLENKGIRKITIRTSVGKVTVARTWLAPMDEDSADRLYEMDGISGVYPLDYHLGIVNAPFKCTCNAVADIARAGISCNSYEDAAELIKKISGEPISVAQVKLITDYVGDLVYRDDCKRAEEAKQTTGMSIDRRKISKRKGDILTIEFDGSYTALRKDKQGNPGGWKECKIAIAFRSDDYKRWINKKGEEVAKMGRRDIVGIIGTVDDFENHLIALANRNNYNYCHEIVVITDGALWILPFVKRVLPRAQPILDKYHIKENIAKYSHGMIRGKNKQQDFITEMYEMVDRGDVTGMLAKLLPYKDRTRPQGIPDLYNYIHEHKECMNYPEYERKGYFVGSGAIESCHRYVMQDRMKNGNQRWNKKEGQGVLSCKCRKESKKWHEVVSLINTDYQQRRHQRVNRKRWNRKAKTNDATSQCDL